MNQDQCEKSLIKRKKEYNDLYRQHSDLQTNYGNLMKENTMSRYIAIYPGKKECSGIPPLTLLEEGIADVRLEPNANFSYKYLDSSFCSSVSVVPLPDLSMVHMSFSNG